MNTAPPSKNDRRRVLDVPCNDRSVVSIAAPPLDSKKDETPQRPNNRPDVSSMMNAFRATRSAMDGRTEQDLVADAILDRSGPGSLRWDLMHVTDEEKAALNEL